ncbi:3,4-dihydroxy-2-butanone-4-phosphate synthase [Rhodococcus pyridinivorans]
MSGEEHAMTSFVLDHTTAAAPGSLEADGMGVLLDHDGAVLFANAQAVTTQQMAFAIRFSSGLIHAAMHADDLDRLRIPDQPVFATELSGLDFTVAVDAVGVGTGISAFDRALTLRTLADPTTTTSDLRRPGHVLPVRCRPHQSGLAATVWERVLAVLVAHGYAPVAGACRLVDDQGEVLDENDGREFAALHDLSVYR